MTTDEKLTVIDSVEDLKINEKEFTKENISNQFIDGWDFTPDVGNGKSRGEIFTPRFIVDKMIAMGIIPPSIVYFDNYEKFKDGALDVDRFDILLSQLMLEGLDHNLLANTPYEDYREYIKTPLVDRTKVGKLTDAIPEEIEKLDDISRMPKLVEFLIEKDYMHQADLENSQFIMYLQDKLVLTDYDKILDTTVQEPAVGTGNFSATIAWYKLNVAFLHAMQDDGSFNNELLENNIKRAIQSQYFFDIDPGNVEVTTRRIMKYTDLDINNEEIVMFWADKIGLLLELEQQIEEPDYSIVYDEERFGQIVENVQDSMDKAMEQWNKFLIENDSILEQLYDKYLGETPPDDLIDELIEVFEFNALVYNGISEFQSDNIPGWRKIKIQKYKDGEPDVVISMHNFLVNKKIAQLVEENDELINHMELVVVKGKETEKWDNRKNANAYKKNVKLIEELSDSLDVD